MVEEQDIVIMISNSGETDEILQLIPSFHKIGCKLISLVCSKNSTMSKYSDIEWYVPIEREACVHGIAPTTSTTATLVVGDALAIVLSRLKCFKTEDFALFHPKGSLGKRLLTTVNDIMEKTENFAISEDSTIQEALFTITKNHLGAVCVVDKEGGLAGLISDGDIRRSLEKNAFCLQGYAFDSMTKNPIVVESGKLVIDAFKIMNGKKISVLPVISQENKVLGIVTLHDILETGIIG